MLGEQYADLKGKTAGQNILGIEDPTIERSVSASGAMKGISLQENDNIYWYNNSSK
jgi:hypothetical protein